MTDAPDIARIFQLTLQACQNEMIGEKGLRFAHIYAFKADGTMSVFALDPSIFEPGAVKSTYAAMLREKLIKEGYKAYGFCSEVWISKRLTPDFQPDRLPQDDPNRTEALQIIVGTRQRGYSRQYRMVKRPDGTIKRLSEMEYDPNWNGGRYGHLLTPEPWTGTPVRGSDGAKRNDPGSRLRH